LLQSVTGISRVSPMPIDAPVLCRAAPFAALRGPICIGEIGEIGESELSGFCLLRQQVAVAPAQIGESARAVAHACFALLPSDQLRSPLITRLPRFLNRRWMVGSLLPSSRAILLATSCFVGRGATYRRSPSRFHLRVFGASSRNLSAARRWSS